MKYLYFTVNQRCETDENDNLARSYNYIVLKYRQVYIHIRNACTIMAMGWNYFGSICIWL